jgi:hypothetical protein
MAFPSGPLAGHFLASEVPALIPAHRQQGLFNVTRGLIYRFLGNTVFSRGVLTFSFVPTVLVFTIFSRRSLGNVPYLLTELGKNLRTDAVDRAKIDQSTENTIRALAADLTNLPAVPLPVIVEDCTGQNYLILEGNKRLSAVALADPAFPPPPREALVGRTSLSWPQMLAFFNMVPAP